MSYAIVNNSKKIVVDTFDEIKTLPSFFDMGTEALCLEDGQKYIKNSSNSWVQIPSGEGGGTTVVKGKDGKSAYEIAVDSGFTGTIEQWLDSLKGQDGVSPHVGENGNWFIDNNDTGVAASAAAIYNELKNSFEELINSKLYGGAKGFVDGLDELNLMLENNEPEVEIVLNKNLTVTTPIEIPEGKKVILDLGGKTISGQIPIQGTGGELVLKNGTIQGTSDAVYLTEGSKLTLDGANVVSTRGNGVSAWSGSEVVVNSGSITSQEAGIAGFKNSTITINGGTITGIDNGAVMGNGSVAGTQNDGSNMNVIMNGGKLIGHITSAGYQACGVYIPNTGSFTMNGGEIISDGCGICMRGGQVNLNSGTITANGPSGFVGKVGDSRVTVGSYAIVYDVDSKYPGMASLELNIEDGMILQGTDGDISILPLNATANINDNRNKGE